MRGALASRSGDGPPVIGVLCFTNADLPLPGPVEMRGHLPLYPKTLTKRLTAAGPLHHADRAELAATLERALAPA